MGENVGAGSAEEDLRRLAGLIVEHNRIAAQMTALIGRPAIIGHLGEYIASKVFDIRLEVSAVNKGFDGRFASGPLAGKTVDVKFYGKLEGLLDIRVDAVPDFYLVLTGPRSPAMTSRGEERLWSIEGVYLFDAPALVERLRARGLRLGVATSVRREHWEAAEVYPVARCRTQVLSDHQRGMLSLFHGGTQGG